MQRVILTVRTAKKPDMKRKKPSIGREQRIIRLLHMQQAAVLLTRSRMMHHSLLRIIMIIIKLKEVIISARLIQITAGM